MGAQDIVVANDFSVFSNLTNFETAQRMAKMLAQSDMVPDAYRGRIENCVIALELSHRLRVSAFLVMQNLIVIHGKPSWSSVFVIAAINSCGKFEPLEFHLSGEGDARQCYASSRVIATGKEVRGPVVSVKMAKAEGWWDRKGSKWPTMTDIMLTYRTASFFGKLYAPEVTLGMHTSEEAFDAPSAPIKDMGPADVVDQASSAESLNELLNGTAPAATTGGPGAATPSPTSTVVIDGSTGAVVGNKAIDPAFELAKIIEGCEQARTAEDLKPLEALARTLPDDEKAEALGTIGHRRAELMTPKSGKQQGFDDLLR